jgi:hypothetical protein
MTILEAIKLAIESPRTGLAGDRFRTLLKQLQELGIDINQDVDFLNNEEVFKNLVNAVYSGKADLGKGADSARNFRDSLNTVINTGKSTDKASVLENKKTKSWMDKNFGSKNVGENRYIPTDDVAYQQTTDRYIRRTVQRSERIVSPLDTADSLYEKVQNKLIKPHQINKAIRDLSIKNYFILRSTTGLRAPEVLDITIRKNVSEQDIKAGKRPYRIEDGIVRNVGLKGTSTMRINYPLGNYHQAVIEDQIRLAALNKELVQDTRFDTYKQSFTKELWPTLRKQMHVKVGNALRPEFLESGMQWMHEDTSVTKTFKVSHLRNQFSRLMEATVNGDPHKIGRAMGHVQGSTKDTFYSRVPISAKALENMQKKVPIESRKVITSVASDLDSMVKTIYGDSFERNTSDLARNHGIDKVKGEVGKTTKSPEQFNLNLSETTVTPDPIDTNDLKEVQKNITSSKETSNVAKSNIKNLQNEYKKTGELLDAPVIKPKPLSKKQIADDLMDEFWDTDLDDSKSNIGHNMKEATEEDVNKVVTETGADINTSEGKAKVMKALGKIGRKLPLVGVAFGTYAAGTTLKADASEFEAPKGGDLASMLFGLKSGEDRQKARAAYQQVESLPFVPMFIPPAEDVFPTEQEREEEREQTGAQMEALFTGA